MQLGEGFVGVEFGDAGFTARGLSGSVRSGWTGFVAFVSLALVSRQGGSVARGLGLRRDSGAAASAGADIESD